MIISIIKNDLARDKAFSMPGMINPPGRVIAPGDFWYPFTPEFDAF